MYRLISALWLHKTLDMNVFCPQLDFLQYRISRVKHSRVRFMNPFLSRLMRRALFGGFYVRYHSNKNDFRVLVFLFFQYGTDARATGKAVEWMYFLRVWLIGSSRCVREDAPPWPLGLMFIHAGFSWGPRGRPNTRRNENGLQERTPSSAPTLITFGFC